MKIPIDLDECDMDYIIDALDENLSRVHPSSVRQLKYIIDRIKIKRMELKEIEKKIYNDTIIRRNERRDQNANQKNKHD